MNKQKLIIVGVLVAISITIISATATSITAFTIPNSEQYIYTSSDITKANPNLVMGSGGFSMLEDIGYTKDTIVLTLSGTVLSVGDPINWNHEGHKYGSVPVTIEIDKKTKDHNTDVKIETDDLFTFYLGGMYEQNKHYINGFEPQFEIGEDVIVHIAKDYIGPDGLDGNNYFVELGMFGKYKIIEEKAYNEKYPTGKSLYSAFNEAK